MKELKQCVVCGRIDSLDVESIHTCCNYSMFFKHDIKCVKGD